MDKLCRTCKENKPLNCFSIASSGKKLHNFRTRKRMHKTQCKSCDAAYARNWRKTHKNYQGSGKLIKYGNNRLLASAVGARLIDARMRIKKHKQLPTDLTKDWLIELFIQQKGCCALSKQKLSIEPGQVHTLSLDKIIPNEGYIKGNVQWLCWAVNRAKGDLDTKMFLNMCRRITERCNDYP